MQIEKQHKANSGLVEQKQVGSILYSRRNISQRSFSVFGRSVTFTVRQSDATRRLESKQISSANLLTFVSLSFPISKADMVQNTGNVVSQVQSRSNLNELLHGPSDQSRSSVDATRAQLPAWVWLMLGHLARGSFVYQFLVGLQRSSRSLVMFVFKPNPVTGCVEWMPRKDDDRAFADDIAKYGRAFSCNAV